jgi:hypothetical protein
MENSIVQVPYVSVWDGGSTVETTANVNLATGEVTEIVVALGNVGDLEFCEREYIVLNDEEVEVHYNENGFEYWADIDGSYEGDKIF